MKLNFSDIFKEIVKRFQKIGYNLKIMRHTACLVLTKSPLIAMLHSLVARRWFRSQTQWRLLYKALLEVVG